VKTEADIVILSLVRSNPHGQIGFLNSPERVNVALSRARHSLIILGNASTLQNSANPQGSKLWTTIINSYRQNRQLFAGFPAVCPNHPINEPSNFETETCQVPCHKLVSCRKHKCPLKCHFSRNHSLFICRALVTELCHAQLHQLEFACSEGKPRTCKQCVKLDEMQKELVLETSRLSCSSEVSGTGITQLNVSQQVPRPQPRLYAEHQQPDRLWSWLTEWLTILH
jgi:hypothetical protein